MNQNSPASPAEHDTANRDNTLEQRRLLDPRALAAALAGIRADSQRETETYLRDTVVPHGGE
jgi:hypothetical protein